MQDLITKNEKRRQSPIDECLTFLRPLPPTPQDRVYPATNGPPHSNGHYQAYHEQARFERVPKPPKRHCVASCGERNVDSRAGKNAQESRWQIMSEWNPCNTEEVILQIKWKHGAESHQADDAPSAFGDRALDCLPQKVVPGQRLYLVTR